MRITFVQNEEDWQKLVQSLLWNCDDITDGSCPIEYPCIASLHFNELTCVWHFNYMYIPELIEEFENLLKGSSISELMLSDQLSLRNLGKFFSKMKG